MQVMAMEPGHWAWQRQRPAHHIGAVRSYARDLDFYELRGPYETPRGPCDLCLALLDPLAAEPAVKLAAGGHGAADVSWCLGSSGGSSEDDEDEEVVALCYLADKQQPVFWPSFNMRGTV